MSHGTRQLVGIACKSHWHSPRVWCVSRSGTFKHGASPQITWKKYHQISHQNTQAYYNVGKYQQNCNGSTMVAKICRHRVAPCVRIKEQAWCARRHCHNGATGAEDEPKSPHVQLRKSRRIVHGEEIEDEFQWMQKQGHEKILQDYIEQENRFTKKSLRSSSHFQKKMIAEMNCIDTRQQSIDPFYIRSSAYEYWREPQNDGSFIYLRTSVTKDHERQIILDTADLLRRYNYPSESALTVIKVSRCQQYAACMVEDYHNPDTYNTHVIKIRGDGYEYNDVICATVRFEFGSKNTLFYTKPNTLNPLRACQVWERQIGEQDNCQDPCLMYDEKDERFFVDLYPTRDGHYICVASSMMQSMTEVYLIDTASTSTQDSLLEMSNVPVTPRLVWARQDGLEYYVEHHHGMLYILANFGDGWQVYKIPADEPSNPDTKINGLFSRKFDKVGGFEIVGDSCIVSVINWDEGIKLVMKSLTNLREAEQEIQLGSQYCTISHISPTCTGMDNSQGFDFSMSSPIQHPIYFNYQPTSSSVVKLPGQEETSEVKNLVCTRIKCQSMDGTCVPITLFHNKELTLDMTNPLLVCGYGAYGLDVEMGYSPEMTPLLERGWIIAYCHIRGGGELGRRWAQDGRQLNKPHTFEDFESCISHLHEAKFSQPRLTAAYGISAGGLTIAAHCNRAPHLIQAAILKMPFLDVLTTMLDPTLPLTIQDYDEYGDPTKDKEIFETIKKYCPYHNITNQDYPSLYVTTSMTDKRVPPYGPIKYIAKLRRVMRRRMSQSRDITKPLILLEVDQEGGHFGSLDSEVQCSLITSEWAFLYQAMGLPHR